MITSNNKNKEGSRKMYTISKFAYMSIYKHTKKNLNTKNHSSSSSENSKHQSIQIFQKENKQIPNLKKKVCMCLTKKRIGNGKRRGGGLGKKKNKL